MSTSPLFISNNLKELQQFLKSTDFWKGLRVGVAITLPILIIGYIFGHYEMGMALAYGAFWSSPSDVSGSFQHKKIGILTSATLVMFVSFIGGYLHYETWLSLPVLGILGFGIAFISVYGFRASLVSFSGLLALILSLAHESEEMEVYQYALLIGVGGLWYLLLTKIWFRINPKAETEEYLTETYELTAKFLEKRGKLIGSPDDHQKIQTELRNLQIQLTDNHEVLREILILSRKTSGWSNYQDKRLMVFVQLVEMLETAIANPGNYDRMDALFHEHPQYVEIFQNLIFKISHQLRMIANVGIDKKRLPKNDDIRACIEDVRLKIALLRETLKYDDYLMLRNFLEYQEKQYQKLKRIKLLLGAPNLEEMELFDRKSAHSLVAPQDYDPMLLLGNFSFKSTIFRHSVRLAVTVMIGYSVGLLFPLQNPHWILLTIIVILRPNYGLTKDRAKDRIIGTFIGGAIGAALIFWIRDPYLFGVMGVASLIISISMVQKNYTAAAIFITMSVVFIYAILQPDVLTGVKFRLLDTVVGAGLSYAAMRVLWPTWEFVEIHESIIKRVKANKDFLHEITEYYQQKGSIPTSYNLARKIAFWETSNLDSAFQRMTQEPNSKQKEVDKIYELVVLNHAFLSSLASLSTYLQHHKSGETSEQFMLATEKIKKNLEQVVQCLNDKNGHVMGWSSEDDNIFEELLPTIKSIQVKDWDSKDKETIRTLQEAHLIREQLQWLYSMSGKMIKLVESVNMY